MATSRLCSIPDCGKPHLALGLCGVHYRKWKRESSPKCSADGCSNVSHTGGYCSTHHRLRREYGTLSRRGPSKGAPLRFYQNVVLPYEGNDCLVWPYARNAGGYGRLHLNGRMNTVTRLACEAINGLPPTKDHFAAHSCGKGHMGCCNPRHLRWATPKENSADMIAHGNSPRGERQGSSKLTRGEVSQILALEGAHTHSEIAQKFGVTRSTISAIYRRKSWAWLSIPV